MNRYAATFTPETEFMFNNSGTAISVGHLVTWSESVSNVEDPIPEPAMAKKPMLDNQATRSTAVTRPKAIVKCSSATGISSPRSRILTQRRSLAGLYGTADMRRIGEGPR